MAGLARIFTAVQTLGDPTVDRSLAAALPTARGDARERIVEAILARDQPAGLQGLVDHLHRLPPSLRLHVLAHADQLYRPIREALRQDQAQPAGNAVSLINEARLTKLAYLLPPRLRQGTSSDHPSIAGCLLRLTTAACGADGRSNRTAEAIAHVAAAVDEAAVVYPTHQQPAILLAWLKLLPAPLPRSTALLRGVSGRAGGLAEAIASLLEDPQTPEAAQALFRLIHEPALLAPALTGLQRLATHGRLGEALQAHHLLSLRSVRGALTCRPGPAPPVPDPKSIAAATPSQCIGLVAYAACLPEPVSNRVARLLAMGKSSEMAVRLAVLRRLLVIAQRAPDTAADDAIATFATDADESLARLALWRLIRTGYRDLPKILTALVNSRHEGIRRLAAERLAPTAFARLWDAWPRMTQERRLVAARALMVIDPMFHRSLGEKLLTVDREVRLRTLSMIGELNQGEFFAEGLILLTQAPDAYVASAAVKALGTASGKSAVRALEAALQHADARVRANAVEALAEVRSTRHVESLLQMTDDTANRPRANAIAALLELRTPEALTALRRMLGDPRSNHRHSALWLVEKVGLLDLARQVAELSISDPDSAVRERADQVVGQLLDLLQHQVDDAVLDRLQPSEAP